MSRDFKLEFLKFWFGLIWRLQPLKFGQKNWLNFDSSWVCKPQNSRKLRLGLKVFGIPIPFHERYMQDEVGSL